MFCGHWVGRRRDDLEYGNSDDCEKMEPASSEWAVPLRKFTTSSSSKWIPSLNSNESSIEYLDLTNRVTKHNGSTGCVLINSIKQLWTCLSQCAFNSVQVHLSRVTKWQRSHVRLNQVVLSFYLVLTNSNNCSLIPQEWLVIIVVSLLVLSPRLYSLVLSWVALLIVRMAEAVVPISFEYLGNGSTWNAVFGVVDNRLRGKGVIPGECPERNEMSLWNDRDNSQGMG